MQDPLETIRELARDGHLREQFDAVKDDIAAATMEREMQKVSDGPTFAEEGSVEPEITMPNAAYDESVSSNLWEILACDIALNKGDIYAIAKAYNVELDQIEALLDNEQFLKLLKKKQQQVQLLGDRAKFVMKMQAVAEQGIPHLARHLFSPHTPTKDFVSLYKQVVELAEYVPRETASSSSTAVGVTFNIQGVPGLEHLSSHTTTIEMDTSSKPKVTQPETIEMEEL